MFRSNAKPSTYGYPAPLEEKKKEDKEKVATAILSITVKQKRKAAEKKKEEEKMEVIFHFGGVVSSISVFLTLLDGFNSHFNKCI